MIPEAPQPAVLEKLAAPGNIWLASVRPDGRPHLTPVWYVFADNKIYCCIDPHSVKADNLAHNPRLSLALEDGAHPVICEGLAQPLQPPWPPAVVAGFQARYDWDITAETQYTQLVEITPHKWLAW